MAEFVRLAEVVNKKKDMRVVSVTVVPTIADCFGRSGLPTSSCRKAPR